MLIAARYVMEGKKETHLDENVGTLHVIALDNIPYNKNNITRKVVTLFLTQ